MRITILTFGTQGDIQPLVALGMALKKAGYSVTVATDKNYESFITDSALDFAPVAGDIRALIQSRGGQDMVAQGQDPNNFARDISRLVQPVIMQMMADCWNACQGTDVILSSQWGNYPGVPIAQKLGIPVIKCNLVPMSPTQAFPSTQMPPSKYLRGGLYNYASGFITQQVFWQTFRPAVNSARREIMGMPSDSFWGPAAKESRRIPVLYGFSQHVVPRPSDWSGNIQVTGYWFRKRDEGWRPSKELSDFLQAGSPPVYIGFGSINNRNPRDSAALIIKALEAVGQRGILLKGWGGLSQSDLPENIIMVDSVPHDWLFCRTGAVVHHGGAGTTAAGLRAGVPTVIIPFMSDQSFWGRRIEMLGVGPRPIPRPQLTAENLAQAVDQALHDPALRTEAARLGEMIRAEDGVSCAVAAIDTLLQATE